MWRFPATLLAAGVALPRDRVPASRGRRCAAGFDEDSVTLAAQAGERALENASHPVGLILASTSPPYEEGGSAQLVAELLGLSPTTFLTELSSTMRDGLAALRIAAALAASAEGSVLVCAAHRRRPTGEPDTGDGAIALLIGPSGREGLATLRPGPVRSEELRDTWRLAGDISPRSSDSSFSAQFGAARVAQLVAAEATGPTLLALPNGAAAARAERELEGPGDPALNRTGVLGAAHPLLRLLCGLDSPGSVVAASGGLAEVVEFAPGPGASELAASLRSEIAAGNDVVAVATSPSREGFQPYASAPRSWRERGPDLRLEGLRFGEEIHYPPPPVAPPGHESERGEPQRLARAGSILTFTRDHVYPGGDITTMAVVSLDDGGRFYGQVVPGAEVEIDQRVRLVPRRLHEGGGILQYYWKVEPCR